MACTATGTLIEIISAQCSVRVVAQVLQEALDFDGPNIREPKRAWPKGPACLLRVSCNGELAAVANRYGEKGVVLDLATGNATMPLNRGNYHSDVSVFPVAFSNRTTGSYLIHGTAWNHLDVSDARTGTLLTRSKNYLRGVKATLALNTTSTTFIVPSMYPLTSSSWPITAGSGPLSASSLLGMYSRWLHENVEPKMVNPRGVFTSDGTTGMGLYVG